MFTLILTFLLSSCGFKKQASPPPLKLEQLVLDSGRAPLANACVWISRAGCYSAYIDRDTNVPATESVRWIERRYQLRIMETDIRVLEVKVSALLTEGRRKFRDPVPGEFIDSLIVTMHAGGTVCIEKPEGEPWMAFDQVKDILLEMHRKFANEPWLLYESEYRYAPWAPPGFLTDEERSAYQLVERKVSKNFLGPEGE